MGLKMNIKAKDDVYEATRQRMAVAEEESKKNWYVTFTLIYTLTPLNPISLPASYSSLTLSKNKTKQKQKMITLQEKERTLAPMTSSRRCMTSSVLIQRVWWK